MLDSPHTPPCKSPALCQVSQLTVYLCPVSTLLLSGGRHCESKNLVHENKRPFQLQTTRHSTGILFFYLSFIFFIHLHATVFESRNSQGHHHIVWIGTTNRPRKKGLFNKSDLTNSVRLSPKPSRSRWHIRNARLFVPDHVTWNDWTWPNIYA